MIHGETRDPEDSQPPVFGRLLLPRRTSMAGFDYDVVVIGAGQGGLPAAHMAAKLGTHVALIEAAEVGGT